jgi:RING-variant domain
MTDFEKTLKLNIKTWARDSHGLFDYEAPTTKNNLLIIQGTCKLIRKKNEVKYLSENSEIPFEERELAKIVFDENKITIINPLNFFMSPTESNINELQNKIWYVIKHDDNSKESPSSIQSTGVYQVNINDIIKLGRVKYAITELKINDKVQTIDKSVEKPVFELISEYKYISILIINIHFINIYNNLNLNSRKIDIATSQDSLCKICYHNADDATNPMINLCKCTGSISSIHFSCLKKWMNTKLTTKENEKKTVLSYSMKAFNCEICMTPYPCKFFYDV